jgi:hypothetical protein
LVAVRRALPQCLVQHHRLVIRALEAATDPPG